MDNTAEFSLKENVQNWKSQLLKTMGSEEVDELESHLYDALDEWTSKGLNEEEAFFIAQKRLGSLQNIKQEYAKVKPFTRALLQLRPMAAGVLLYLFLTAFNDFILNMAVYISDLLGAEKSHIQWVSMSTLSLLGLGCILGFYIFYRSENKGVKRLFQIPNLILLVVVFTILGAGLRPLIFKEIDVNLYGQVTVIRSIFNVVFMLSLLVASYVVFRKTKPHNPTFKSA